MKTRYLCILVLLAVLISSGCMGVQMPILPEGATKLNVDIRPVPMNIQPMNAPIQPKITPTANITITPTPIPRFRYV